jgi:hypothetical protein
MLLELGQEMARAVHSRRCMTPYIDVSFQRSERNPSIESAIHRWVARFAAMGLEVRRGFATVEPTGRNRTTLRLTLILADGTARTATITHADPYVAVSDVFHVVRQQLIMASRPSADRSSAAAGRLVA